MKRCIVVGGGAAGMMAAIQASVDGYQVELLEKNDKLGKKLFITGKGRCNVTNACEPEDFFRNVISNSKFMYSSYYSFDSFAMMQLLSEEGCSLKTERGNRVFPVSDHSSDIIKTLQMLLKKHSVKISLNTCVKHVLYEKYDDQSYKGRVIGVQLANGTKKETDYVILATGGKSYPLTGSTGDGYQMAEELGHTITPCRPALVPLMIKEDWCKELQGLSLKNVAVSIMNDKKTIYSGFGEMMFTHYGVSGPLILSASSVYTKEKDKNNIKLNLDLKPALYIEQLDKRMLRDFEKKQNKKFKNSLDELLPAKLIPIIVRLSGIAPEKEVNEISREERKKLVELLKNMKMTVAGARGFDEAIITQGGIHVKEVNPSTMESKRIKNLFFAGEILDVDALTGGFNLQIAWSTGYMAGKSIAEGEE